MAQGEVPRRDPFPPTSVFRRERHWPECPPTSGERTYPIGQVPGRDFNTTDPDNFDRLPPDERQTGH